MIYLVRGSYGMPDQTGQLGTASLERIKEALLTARRELIDTTRRNRLLHSTRSGKRPHCLEIIVAEVDEIFVGLTRTKSQFGFAPTVDEEHPQSEAEDEHRATRTRKLQTRLGKEPLERRLIKFFREARTLEEEQGINILFLALGFLHWFEDERAQEPCSAPLLLVPVALERRSGRDVFVMKGRDEDMMTNASLAERLRTFGVSLPELPDEEDWVPSAYLKAVAHAIAGQSRWSVEATGIGLGFFTFSKFLMWRDLDSATWPDPSGLLASPLVARLLGEDVAGEVSSPIVEENEPIDHHIDMAAAIHVLDADSSQALCIEEARRSQNLVIQGPPGTGKSQTIANVIAAAVHEGKSVLFVAEKAAALEVVGGRLKKVGLEALCLELHSKKATKQSVIASLERALRAGIATRDDAKTAGELRAARDRLNNWTAALHRNIRDTGRTPYWVIGSLLKLHQHATPRLDARLDVAASWRREDFLERERAVERAAAAIAKLDVRPEAHAWSGAYGPRLSPFDRDRLRDLLREVQHQIDELASLGREAMALLRLSQDDVSCSGMRAVIASLTALSNVPEGRELLGEDVWRSERARIERLVRQGEIWSSTRPRVVEQVTASAFDADSETTRKAIAAYGRSLHRPFVKSYRLALVDLRTLCRLRPPKGARNRTALLDDLVACQSAKRVIEEDGEFGRLALGRLWEKENTDWSKVGTLLRWASGAEQLSPDLLAIASIADPRESGALAAKLSSAVSTFIEAFSKFSALVQPRLQEIFDVAELEDAPIAQLVSRIDIWTSGISRINDWVAAREAFESLTKLELGPLAEALRKGLIRPDQARPVMDLLVAEALWARAREDDPMLDQIDGIERSDTVFQFQELDHRRIELSRAEVLESYVERRPNGFAGQMGVIHAEIAKRRRHLPIRKLMEQAGLAVQKVKPVFLMSPLSVAQFLPVGHLTFDLLVIDEASQVPPEEAIGAVARARQMVVVGDDKQLPPTNFFRMVDADDDDPPDDAGQGAVQIRAGDFESILTLARARGVPERMLRWHYRSRHPSLIAVSNATCYGGNLLLPPSPLTNVDQVGLTLVKTPRGYYERGGSGRNPIEANFIAEAIEKHLVNYPDRSLGVACFSVAQRDAIEDAMQARSIVTAADAFAPRGERLFVKNLETVQGDERDVIFISIGYGPDADGRMTLGFGPLSSDGGERRLNVLISRARERCVVFSPITSGDIPPDVRAHGTNMLRRFLHFAETGHIAAGEVTRAEYDSPFEEAVAIAIQRAGYNVIPQIGVSGFRVDLGIVHPRQPGRFVLGIECDGAAYHSGRSARDRDRLRQEVLEGMGWRLHRIWSTDWFRNQNRETERALHAIDEAIESEDVEVRRPSKFESVDVVDERGSSEEVQKPSEPYEPQASYDRLADPYRECKLRIGSGFDFLTLADRELERLVKSVVAEEGPIHTEEVARRVREAFGLERTGRRILELITLALRRLSKQGALTHERDFWTATAAKLPKPRSRRAAALALRRADRIAPVEYRLAIEEMLRASVAASTSELKVSVARLLGFDRTGNDLDHAIGKEISRMIKDGKVQELEGRLHLV
jgi:very-short-patch-repair endonuclease